VDARIGHVVMTMRTLELMVPTSGIVFNTYLNSPPFQMLNRGEIGVSVGSLDSEAVLDSDLNSPCLPGSPNLPLAG
jgi:hypothetical protein